MPKPSESRVWNQISRRQSARYRVQARLDVTVLRSGVPDTVPGRVVDLGAGGVAAMLAREVVPGESVGVEIQLPGSSQRLRTRGFVRHHNKLRCGMEFVGLSDDQKAEIQKFTRRPKAQTDLPAKPLPANTKKIKPISADTSGSNGGLKSGPSKIAVPVAGPPSANLRKRGWIFLLASGAVLLAVLWWRWDRGWQELESGFQPSEVNVRPEAHVSADEMQKLITHRVDPEYPEAGRAAHQQGVVVLDIIIGREGTVLNVKPVSGLDMFTEPATEALRWWRFQPYRVNGRPVVVETTVAVEFKP